MKVFLRIQYQTQASNEKKESLGIHTANTEFLRNLIRFSKKIDEFGLVITDPLEKEALTSIFPDKIINFHRFDSDHELESVLKKYDVFFMADYRISEILKCQNYFQRKMAIVGVTHSLHFKEIISSLRQAADLSATKDVLVCTSSPAKKAVEKILAEKSGCLNLKVVPFGVDDDKYSPASPDQKKNIRNAFNLPSDATIFLYLGRLSPVEKMELIPLLKAFALMAKDKEVHNNPLLVIIGREHNAGYIKILQDVAEKIGITGKVKIISDYRPEDISKFYKMADVFVSPSENIQETFGLTIIEAMSAGLPVVASDWDGYRDNVQKGLTGYLVPTYWADCNWGWDDRFQLTQSVAVDIYAMAEYLKILAVDSILRLKMGKAAREHVLNNLSWEKIIEKYDALFTEAILANRTGEKHTPEESVDLPSPFSVFEDYPSHVLTSEDSLVLKDVNGFTAYSNVEQLADISLINSIINMAYPQPLKIAGIITAIKLKHNIVEANIFRQIMLLLKYGVLEIVTENKI
ncbi:MAG: glycosyltransferase family 4 protein [Smithellaceae bacterium]